MKHVFSILFLCLIFQSVLAKKKSIKMRMAKVAQALKLITDAKEKKLRKLQNTDLVSDTEAGADSTNATVSSLETDTSSTQPSASGTSSTQPSASGTSSTQPSASGTSSTQPSASGTSSTQPSASETSAAQTSASETSAAQTSASETSAAQTSASETSSTQTSGSDTNSTETSAAQTSAAGIPDTSVATTAPTEAYVDNTPVTAPESANATASNAEVPVTKPVATKPKTTTNTKAAVQVSKFHSFSKPTTPGTGKVNFGAFFYFFGRLIPKYIIVRLRITYIRGLRNLQEAIAESARTDCTIKNTALLGTILSEGEGANVDYICEAEGTKGDVSTANFTLNTDVPITMVNANGTTETFDFAEVNFNGDSVETASSLQENTEIINSAYYLKNTIAYIDKYVLRLSGTFSDHRLLRRLALTDGTINMNLTDANDVTNEYECYLSGTQSTSTDLTCDTSSNPLKTTVGKLHLSSGIKKGETLFVEMNKPDENGTYGIAPSAGGSRYTYSKSSSGLSGGAIAGIVIACVVALAAASIAAIMLRKPTPPVDNTTIVDLKTETI